MRVLLSVDEEKSHCLGSLEALVHAIPERRGWTVDVDRDIVTRRIRVSFNKTLLSIHSLYTADMMMHYDKSFDANRPFDGPVERWFFYMANTSIEGETPIACLIAYEESLGYLSKVNEVLEPVEVTPVPPAIRKRVIIL